MDIEIKLYGSFKKYLFDSDYFKKNKKNVSIDKLLEILKIPKKEISLVFINGKKANNHSILKNGDLVQLFPFIGGG